METKSYRALACCASSSYRSTHYGSAVPASGFRRDAHCQTAHRTGATTGRGGWELGREAPDADSPTGCPQPGAAVPVRASAASGDNPDGVSRNCLPAGPWSCGKTCGCAPTHRARFDCEVLRIRGPGGAAFQHVSSRYTHTRGPERPSSSVRRTRFSLTDLRKSEPDITSAKWHVGRGGRRGRAGRRGFGDRT